MSSPCAFDLTGPYAYDLAMQALWVPVIADPQAPTDVEIATGVDLSVSPYWLTDIIGWEYDTEIIKDGEWGPQRVGRLGTQDAEDTRMVFAADRAGVDIRSLLDRGDTGNVVLLPSGPYLEHPTAPINVYPVRVAHLTQRQRFREPGAQIMVNFAVTALIGNNVFVVGP